MKKSWIRNLLVLVMAVLLVFSLVACNPDGGDNGGNNGNGDNEPPVEFSTGDYFNKLWDLTAEIGSKPVSATDDIALHLGVVLTLNTRKPRGSKEIVQQIDLGLDIQAVLGRTAATSQKTALKVRFYDPTDADNNEIVTLYMFANDLDSIYLDFSGHNVKVPHNLVKTVWNEVMGNESNLGDEIVNGLNYPLFGTEDAKSSINDIINKFVGDFGPNWTLNTIINRVLEMTGLPIKQLLTDNWGLIGGLLEGLKVEDIFDEAGDLRLDLLLTNDSLKDLFTATKTVNNGVTTYKAVIDRMVVSMLASGSFLQNAGLTDMFGNDSGRSEIALSFTEKANKIDSFSISAILGGMQTALGKVNGVETVVVPEVVLTITDLSIEKASDANSVKINKDEYSENIAVEEKLTVGIHGITINPIEGLTENAITLDHDVTLTLIGQIDIVNVKNNKTKLNAYIDITDGNGKTSRFATVSFVDGKLAGELTTAISLGENKTIKGFVYDTKINVAQMFHDFVVKIANGIIGGGNNGDATAMAKDENGEEFIQDGAGFSASNWIKAIKTLLPMLSTDNNLQLSTDNILKAVVDVVNNFGSKRVYEDKLDEAGNVIMSDGKPVKVWNEYNYFTWTEKGRIERIVNVLSNPPMADKDLMECVQFIIEKLTPQEGGDPVAEGDTVEKEPTIMDAALRILYICAQSIEIEGVEVPADGNAYVENIKAVLGGTVNFVGDLKGGLHASIELKVGDAVLSITESLELIEVVESTFTDVYAHYTAASEQEKAQWINLADMMA